MSKTKLRKTIAQVGYAPAIINAATGEMTYGGVTWFPHNEAGGREYSVAPNGETTEVYADGIEVYGAEENHGYDIDLTLLRVTDDVDEAWLGRAIEESGVAEYATNQENPHFALCIIEDTTDGVGLTSVYYNCRCSERPEEAGKTSEGGGFDPEFPTYKIAARPRPEDALVKMRIDGKDRFKQIPEPTGTQAASISIDNAVLSPMFRGSVTEYTASATASTGVISVVPASASATVEIANGGTTVPNNSAAVLAAGQTISVTVTNGEQSRTYNITIAEG